jgi:hypothetical protein
MTAPFATAPDHVYNPNGPRLSNLADLHARTCRHGKSACAVGADSGEKDVPASDQIP